MKTEKEIDRVIDYFEKQLSRPVAEYLQNNTIDMMFEMYKESKFFEEIKYQLEQTELIGKLKALEWIKK